jgi:hypothetical protein
MCHERWIRRRERDAEDARELWLDFERSAPAAGDEPADRPPEPDPTRVEAREEPVTAGR